jgi:purine-cytosine permease-like protein
MSEYMVVRPVRLRKQSDNTNPFVIAWWANAFVSTAIVVLTFTGAISYTAGVITLAALTYTLFVMIYVKIMKNDRQQEREL